MGSSFVEYRDHGFWASDGLLELWLDELADAVPDDAPQWLRGAREHWRVQAHLGLQGSIDTDLDGLLTSPDRVQAALTVAAAADRHLGQLGAGTGTIAAATLNERLADGEGFWTSDLAVDQVRQIPDAFTALLRGELRTTATTSPVLPLASCHADAPPDSGSTQSS